MPACMSYVFYKVLHLLGLMLTFLGTGGVLLFATSAREDATRWRKIAGITHGIGLLLLVVAGFGIIAKLKMPLEGWIHAKIVIWLLIGGLPFMVRRKPALGLAVWGIIAALGLGAAYLAVVRPF